MSVSDIFTLNTSIAPRLIRILYVIALVLIAIGMIAGVARGIATMVRPPQQRIAVIGPRPQPPAPPQQASTPEAAPSPSAPVQSDAAAPVSFTGTCRNTDAARAAGSTFAATRPTRIVWPTRSWRTVWTGTTFCQSRRPWRWT